MKSHARVVVIGGGIVGCSVLYHLTSLGWRDVVLLERDELTSGATWHAAGLNHLYAATPFMTRIARESLDLYRQLEADNGQAGGVHITGGVRLARSRDGIDEFKRFLGPAKAAGVEAEIIGPSRVRELFPLLKTEDFLGALHTPGEGYVDAAITTNALADKARVAGASIYRRTAVTGLRQLRSSEWRIDTTQGSMVAETVINCAGPWGGEISKLFGEYLPVVTQEHQYLVTEQTDATAGLDHELPVLRDPSVPFYCRQERSGLMVSGFEHNVKFAWLDGAPADFSMSLYPADLDRAMPCLEQSFEMIPILKDLGIRVVVNGPIPATPDMQALIGPAHGLRGYFSCCGVHGGFVQGGLTRYLAEWVVEGEPSVDLSMVDVRRFGSHVDQEFTTARIEAAHTMFSLPAMYPAMEPQGGRCARVDPLYELLVDRGAVFGEANGWEIPNWFAKPGQRRRDEWCFARSNWFENVGEECHAVRSGAGVLNQASQALFRVSGDKASSFLARALTGVLPNRGQRRLCLALTPRGGIDLTVNVDARDDGSFWLSGPARAEQRVQDWLGARVQGTSVDIENRTDTDATLLVAGPRAASVIQNALSVPASGMRRDDIMELSFADRQTHVIRVDDIDAMAFEITMPMHAQREIYEALLDVDDPLTPVDFGFRALESLRLERGLPRWGLDFSIESTPDSVGFGSLVDDQATPSASVCAPASEDRRLADYQLVLMQIEHQSLPVDPWGGEIVEHAGEAVGVVTSGAFGHSCAKSLAFAQLRSAVANDAKVMQVLLLGEHYPASIVEAPFPVGAVAAV